MSRKTVLVPVLGLIIALLLSVNPAAAEPSITMNVRPGLGGLYKHNMPVELGVFIENRGPAIQGEIIASIKRNQSQTGTWTYSPELLQTYQAKVDIPAGGKTQISLVVPGAFAAMSPEITLVVNGQEIFSTLVQGAAVPSGIVIIGLGDEPVHGPFTEWLNKRYGTVAVKAVPGEEFPSSTGLLRFVDIVVIYPGSLENLTYEQVQTLHEWTLLGGVLVFSSYSGTVNETGQLLEDLEKVHVSRAGELDNISGTNSGRGLVISSERPVSSMELQNEKLWDLLFLSVVDPNLKENTFQSILRGGGLVDASSLLPQLKVPSVTSLAVFWGAYVLLVGPGLYFLLKRLDKRELAWLLIPGMAFLAAVGLYFTGPLQRLPGPLVQTMATVDIVDQGLAEVNAGVAIVSPRGGDITINGPEEGLVYASTNYGRVTNSSIIMSGQAQQIYFPRVEYQSLRQAGAITLWHDLKGIGSNLWVDESYRLRGEIRNYMDIDLRDCALLVAGNAVKLGELGAGETIEVNHSMVIWGDYTEPSHSHLMGIFPDLEPGSGTDPYAREKRMLSHINQSFNEKVHTLTRSGIITEEIISSKVALSKNQLNNLFNEIYFVGWNDQKLDLFSLEGENQTDEYGLTLYRQQVELDLPASGPLYIPPGFIPYEITGGEGGWRPDWTGIVLYDGTVELSYLLDLPGIPGEFNLQAITFTDFWWKAGVSISLFNFSEDAWHPVPPGTTEMTIQELAPFLSERQDIKVRYEEVNAMPRGVMIPGLGMEGVMEQ